MLPHPGDMSTIKALRLQTLAGNCARSYRADLALHARVGLVVQLHDFSVMAHCALCLLLNRAGISKSGYDYFRLCLFP